MYKKLLNGLVLMLGVTLMVSCSTESSKSSYYRSSADSNLVASPTAVVYSPSSVVIYDENKPLAEPAEEITTIRVDLYNEYGIRRQEAQVNEMLKEQACSMGGNAVILIESPEKKYCYAKVVHTNPIANNAVSSTSTSAVSPVSVTKPGSLS